MQLTDNEGLSDIHPAWSADGNSIYYMHDSEPDQEKPPKYEPWVVKVEAGSASSEKVAGFEPSANNFYNLAWSPDGKYLLYAWGGRDQKTLEIYLALADGTLLHGLTENTSLDANPVWQP